MKKALLYLVPAAVLAISSFLHKGRRLTSTISVDTTQ